MLSTTTDDGTLSMPRSRSNVPRVAYVKVLVYLSILARLPANITLMCQGLAQSHSMVPAVSTLMQAPIL